MTLKKGRALWRLPLIFIKVTSWINSKCRIYTTFKSISEMIKLMSVWCLVSVCKEFLR
jgi:uncharacterized membrane protein